MIVPILKMRKWGFGKCKWLVWGHPTSRWCSHWSLFCLVQWLLVSSTPSCFPPELYWKPSNEARHAFGLHTEKVTLAPENTTRLQATRVLLSLLPHLRKSCGFSSSCHLSYALFGLLAPFCKYSSAQRIFSGAFSSYVWIYLEPGPPALTLPFLFLTALSTWMLQYQLRFNHE